MYLNQFIIGCAVIIVLHLIALFNKRIIVFVMKLTLWVKPILTKVFWHLKKHFKSGSY